MNKKISISSVGKKNGPNEDAYYEDCHRGIFILADGMGGKKCGDLASQFSVETISRMLDSSSLETESTWLFEKKEGLSLEENYLRMALLHANTKLLERAQVEDKVGWLGASSIVAGISDDQIALVSIGNCRAYLFRRGVLTQLNESVSLAEYKKWFPLKKTQNIPLNFLGKSYPDWKVQIDIDSSSLKTLKGGDLILLVSSGLTNSLSPEELLKELDINTNDINKLTKSIMARATHIDPTEDKTIMVILTL